MNATSRTIAKNAGVLLISQLLTWTLTTLMTIFLPRYLGPSGVGQFHLANSVWAIGIVVATFGMDTLLIKEVSRMPGRATEYFGTSLFLRLALYLLTAIALMAYALFAGYERQTLVVLVVVGVGNFFVLAVGAVEATLKGLERMEFISLGNIISKVILTAVTIAVLILGGGTVIVAAVGVPAAIINLTIQFFYLRRIQGIRLRPELGQASAMLKASFPYLIVYIFLVLYTQVDIVIISLLVNEAGVGWYGAADQLFGTLLFVPTVFITAVFPALSRLYASGSDSAGRLMSKTFDLMLMLGVPIGFGVLVIANNFVVLLFGPEFAPSGPILAIMGIVLILTYQNILLGQFLISTDRQNRWTRVMAIATIATIPLDLILIPWCQQRFNNGALGGALAFVITEFGMMLVGLHYLPKGALTRQNAWQTMRIVLAGLIMVAAIWWLRDVVFIVPAALGATVYVMVILLLGVIKQEDKHLLAQVVKGIITRFRGRHTQVVG